MFKDDNLILEEEDYFVVGCFYCHYEEIARFQTITLATTFLNDLMKYQETVMAYFIVEY